jgi:hypothetical protein
MAHMTVLDDWMKGNYRHRRVNRLQSYIPYFHFRAALDEVLITGSNRSAHHTAMR